MPNISPSAYGTWQTCHRLYYSEQILRLQRVREDGARRFGTMYHAGLEAWWHVGGDDAPWKDPDAPFVAAMAAIAENARHIDTDRFDVAKAEAMMLGYHSRWFELQFENVDEGPGEEVWYNVPLRDPDGNTVGEWRMVGKKDAFKKFAVGKRVVEHKTTSSEIDAASDYWARLALDMQVTMYIDAARQTGHPELREVLYDVSRKPGISPKRATPEDKRKMTIGKGCKECGGRGGGKLGPAQGTGKVQQLVAGVITTVDCPDCKGSGWSFDKDGKSNAPRLHSDQRLTDESVDEYRARVREEIIENPDAHYRMGTLTRDDDQIAEARANLVTATGEIESMTKLAEIRSGSIHGRKARECFTQNTGTCMNIYGRRCDFLPVCSREVPNPHESNLYQIRPRSGGAK